MRVCGQHHALTALTWGRRPATHSIGDARAHGPVWTGAENLIPTTI